MATWPGKSANGQPAAVRSPHAYSDGVPLARPVIGDTEAVARTIAEILESGILTNGPKVRELERRAAEYLGVRECVAVASCTAGLMLVLRAMELSGDVLVPSFTFAATAHAVAWNGLRPVFVDVDPDTLTLSPAAVRAAIGVRTSAILATHTFGTPCNVEELEALATANGIRLLFDSAHAFGSRRGDRSVGGYGGAEVFSLTPTKMVIACEGGIIATNDQVLAERCRIGRDYGNPGDYDCRFVGLNARLSEVHAAIALASLETLEDRILHRNHVAALYRDLISDIPGISMPVVSKGDRSTFKDFTILVEAAEFGMTAAALADALKDQGIETRRYYSPPVHSMRAYRSHAATIGDLSVTEWTAERVVTLPLPSDMTDEEVERVAGAIRRIGAAGQSSRPR